MRHFCRKNPRVSAGFRGTKSGGTVLADKALREATERFGATVEAAAQAREAEVVGLQRRQG
jgi:hypothetical protein